MSEQVNHQGREGRPALRRKGRGVAMGKSLWVSLAQVAAAAVIMFVCDTVGSVMARNSDSPPSPGSGILLMVAMLLLAPPGAMIIGALVAERLELAASGAYSLSVLAVILIAVLAMWNPSLFGSVPLLVLVLVAVNLLIGYRTGMHRRWSPPPGTSSSAS